MALHQQTAVAGYGLWRTLSCLGVALTRVSVSFFFSSVPSSTLLLGIKHSVVVNCHFVCFLFTSESGCCCAHCELLSFLSLIGFSTDSLGVCSGGGYCGVNVVGAVSSGTPPRLYDDAALTFEQRRELLCLQTEMEKLVVEKLKGETELKWLELEERRLSLHAGRAAPVLHLTLGAICGWSLSSVNGTLIRFSVYLSE